MDFDVFLEKFDDTIKELKDFVEGDDIKDILGTEAINHFQSSFDNEGFTDENLVKWKDVKRRDKSSPWYGHSGQTGKLSPARTTAKILNGETKELRNAFNYSYITNGVKVINNKAYAAVHQQGLMSKIYGKKAFQQQARPFVGPSVVLTKNINAKIKTEFKRILKK